MPRALAEHRVEPHPEEGGDHGEQDDRKSGHGQKSNTDPMRVEESRVQHRRCADMFQIPMAAASRQANVRDRKSVVEGKSGSVRVDLGGRRNIKKNINDNYINNHHTTPTQYNP